MKGSAMFERIMRHVSRPFRAVLYDVASRRELVVDDFDVALSHPTARGHRFHFRNKTYGIVIPLTLERLGSDACRVSVKAGTVAEPSAMGYRLMRLGFFPDLLATAVGEAGHYLLPVHSGALVDFRQRDPCANSDRIYLEQPEWEKYSMMNCFGCLQEGNNVFAVVDGGDFFCRVNSEYNDGGRNRLYADFTFREKYGDMPEYEDRSVVFHDAGPSAQYDDFAKIYRSHLLERGASLLTERIPGNPCLEYSVDAMRVKIFMAAKQSFVPDGSAPVTVYASFDETCAIMDEMVANGIDKAIITLVGWNLGGHDGAYPTRFPVEPSIGGAEGLKKTVAHAKRLGYQIVPHDNVTDAYRASPDFDYEYVARDEGQEALCSGIWSGGQAYKMCPQVYLHRNGPEFVRIKEEAGFEGHYYLDAQATVLWRCHAPGHPANEKEFSLALAAISGVSRALYGAVSVECAAAYTIPYIDEVALVHCPAGCDNMESLRIPSFQRLDPKAIPFYHIALHGLITYQNLWVHHYANPVKGLLWELAVGARPSMEVSVRTGGNGGEYRDSIAKVKEAYAICFKQLRLQTELVDSFREVAPSVYKVRYANGKGLLVNISDSEWDGLAADSWREI
jgi:hypothetical protein